MDYFGQIERDLREAVIRGAHTPWYTRMLAGARPRSRRGRGVALVLLGLLTGGSALAASGVIPFGSPVRVAKQSARVGGGIPAPGGVRLLPLRVADPAGGLPWGIRVVRTTRGLVCLQLGRVQDGRLGELGIDGSFHNDGRFHPLPARALPRSVVAGLGMGFAELGPTTTCHLPGQAYSGESIGVQSSAAAAIATRGTPHGRLRELYIGVLGAPAISVSYVTEGRRATQQVVPGVGAYLIVLASTPADQPGNGGGAIGTPGGLHPVKPLSAFEYRLSRGVCEKWASGTPPDPCPRPKPLYGPVPLPPAKVRRQTPAVSFVISRRYVTAAVVSFAAPLAISDASASYGLQIPSLRCHGTGGGSFGTSTDRDIAAGARVRQAIAFPFANACGHRSITITVLYRHIGQPTVRVGSVTVTRPAGTVAPAPPRRVP